MSSIAGRVALPLYGPYSASKFALEALNDTLRRELRGAVGVSVIQPGAVVDPDLAAHARRDASCRRSRTRAMGEQLQGMAQEALETGMPVGVVVGAIHHALTADKPRTRYVLGQDARIEAILNHVLPARLMDRLIARIVEQS